MKLSSWKPCFCTHSLFYQSYSPFCVLSAAHLLQFSFWSAAITRSFPQQFSLNPLSCFRCLLTHLFRKTKHGNAGNAAFPRPFSHGGFITIFVHVNAISFLYKISILFLCGFHYLLLHSHILFVLQYFFGIHSHFRIYKMTYYAYYKRWSYSVLLCAPERNISFPLYPSRVYVEYYCISTHKELYLYVVLLKIYKCLFHTLFNRTVRIKASLRNPWNAGKPPWFG